MTITTANNAFTWSTRSNQTHKERNWSNGNGSTHRHSNHLLTLLSPESQGPKPCGRAGRVTVAVEAYSHVIGHFWKEAVWWRLWGPADFRPVLLRKSLLGLTCMSSCYEARGPVSWNPVPGLMSSGLSSDPGDLPPIPVLLQPFSWGSGYKGTKEEKVGVG